MDTQGIAGAPSPSSARTTEQPGKNAQRLMELIVSNSNVRSACKRVEQNDGAAGIDGMRAGGLRPYLHDHWAELKQSLLSGTYKPSPVRRHEIPKPGGGVRLLGIPTALDRFIQQAVLQVLTPLFEPRFSEHSYGFRPGKSARQAVEAARGYIEEGYGFVVDMDLSKLFDRVNHDIVMAKVARVVQDKRVLKLIRASLKAGVMENGVCVRSEEGTPQGGPLSPLLANIMLNDLDWELERRGHRLARYADDCNIYVKSRRAGERVMASVRRFVESKLKLKVNEEKSAVDRPARRKFLGFSFIGGSNPRIRIANKTRERFEERIRKITNPAAMGGAWQAAFASSTPTCEVGWDTSGSRGPRACIRRWTNGCDDACGCAYSNSGRSPRRCDETSSLWAFPRSGRERSAGRARDTGGSRIRRR